MRNIAPKKPNPDDVAAGANIRRIRASRGMSQTELGEALGITFQQVQKYEKGSNRVSISRALMICKALHCNITDLVAGIEDDQADALPLPAQSRQATLLAECFDRIEDARQRRHILGLVAAISHSIEIVDAPLQLIDLQAANGAAA